MNNKRFDTIDRCINDEPRNNHWRFELWQWIAMLSTRYFLLPFFLLSSICSICLYKLLVIVIQAIIFTTHCAFDATMFHWRKSVLSSLETPRILRILTVLYGINHIKRSCWPRKKELRSSSSDALRVVPDESRSKRKRGNYVPCCRENILFERS